MMRENSKRYVICLCGAKQGETSPVITGLWKKRAVEELPKRLVTLTSKQDTHNDGVAPSRLTSESAANLWLCRCQCCYAVSTTSSIMETRPSGPSPMIQRPVMPYDIVMQHLHRRRGKGEGKKERARAEEVACIYIYLVGGLLQRPPHERLARPLCVRAMQWHKLRNALSHAMGHWHPGFAVSRCGVTRVTQSDREDTGANE